MMNTTLIFHECYRDHKEYHDEHNALFVFREFANTEKPFHFFG